MIMEFVKNTLLVLLSGVLDRYRGSEVLNLYGKGFEAFCNGCVIAYLAGFEVKALIAFGFLYVAAISDSYGGPWGAVINNRKMDAREDPHWWMFGPLKTNSHLALGFRALLGGAYLLPACYYSDNYAPALMFSLGFYSSAYIGREFYWRDWIPDFIYRFISKKKPLWDFCEFMRGSLIALLNLLAR